MEVNFLKERLKQLRKILNLSQRAFCKKIGMKQSTYASFETGNRELKETYIKLICQTYNVNENWLKFGTGEIFIQGKDEDITELLEIYDSLTPPLKRYLLNQIRELKSLQDFRDDKN